MISKVFVLEFYGKGLLQKTEKKRPFLPLSAFAVGECFSTR